jgi:putative ABC transport system ATP-binding protein
MNIEKKIILKTAALTKSFRHARSGEITALKNINLTIFEGQYVLLKGHSGSGKTTLFTLLAGIAFPTSGCVYFREKNLNQISDVKLSQLRRNHIGFIFQDFNLFQHLTALENASLPLLPLNLTKKTRHKKAAEILERLGLEERLHHCPEEMSGGERQRLAIARGLINDPDLIIADEPTSNIDMDSINKVGTVFNDLKAKGKTLLITSHHDDLRQDADLIIRLDRGKVVV